MIEQVLFTRPGERVMRPDFGCGLLDQVFEPNAPFIAAATELLVRGALDRWLADDARIENVAIASEDARLVVEVTYTRLIDGGLRAERFVGPAPEGPP